MSDCDPNKTVYTQTFPAIPARAPSGRKWYAGGPLMYPIAILGDSTKETFDLACLAYKAVMDELLWGTGKPAGTEKP